MTRLGTLERARGDGWRRNSTTRVILPMTMWRPKKSSFLQSNRPLLSVHPSWCQNIVQAMPQHSAPWSRCFRHGNSATSPTWFISLPGWSRTRSLCLSGKHLARLRTNSYVFMVWDPLWVLRLYRIHLNSLIQFKITFRHGTEWMDVRTRNESSMLRHIGVRDGGVS